VREELLPYGRQAIEDDDVAAVVEVLRSDWLTTGPNVAEFEQAFAEAVGAAHAVSFSSGTAALHGAVFVTGVAPGDEVVTTPLTFCADANCVVYQGGTPVFADIVDTTLAIDPAEVERKLGPRTKAIIAVDYAGHPAALDELAALAGARGIALIEDACHALGATYRGRRVGAIADLTCFSFHPVKHVATGEGGMVTTADAETARRLRNFRNHGIETDAHQREQQGTWFYEMTALGYNYRLTDMASVLGTSQLRRLDANVAARRTIAARYLAELAELPGLRLPHVEPDVEPAWHLFPIRLELEKLSVARAEVYAALRAEGIGVNVHYVPVHRHPYYRDRFGYVGGEYPVAEAAYDRLLSLPMFHGMSSADADDVVAAVTKVLGAYAA
jgi:perosamine synthetase